MNMELIPGKLYICCDERYIPVLYQLIGDKGLWNKLKVTNTILEKNIPVLYTSKKLEGGTISKSANIYKYYEFLYMERIVYILAISCLDRL